MRDIWMEKLLSDPDLRAKLFIFFTIVQILAIGMLVLGFLIMVLYIVGVF